MENTQNTKYIMISFHSPLSTGVGKEGDQKFASARRGEREMGGWEVGSGGGLKDEDDMR